MFSTEIALSFLKYLAFLCLAMPAYILVIYLWEKWRNRPWMWVILLSLSCSLSAQASPKFCDLEAFKALEVSTNAPKAKRLHCYKVGKLKLCGVAVGGSDANELASMSPADSLNGYCTWYLNKGNKQAELIFNQEYMRGPYWGWLPFNGVVSSYRERLAGHWGNMVECARSTGYVAMGCDGQRHRGPSVFAAFLSLAGCSPSESEKIASNIWGLNGVPKFTRKDIAAIGFDVGNANPDLRKQLLEVMQ